MALPDAVSRKPLVGHAKPRIAPPIPARSDWKAYRETALSMGITLMPWQETAARYLTATGPGGRRLYREVAIVVARQNGKTTLMKPFIIAALRAKKRILHLAANDRDLPRSMFNIIAKELSQEESLFPKRRGKTIWPRYGAGQEEIVLENGGWYRIKATGRGGGRGWSADIVIIDELREADDPEVIGMVEPTLLMSDDPQLVELSNAGSDGSTVLNAVRDRAGRDESLAYLEWSAAPDRLPDDIDGWAEANPAIGHFPSVLTSLEAAYRKHKLGGTMATFETEHLCRWVPSMRERLVSDTDWQACEDPALPDATQPKMAVAMDPDGKRASAAIAWPLAEAPYIGVRVLYEATGDPIDIPAFAKALREAALKARVTATAFDPMTDRELAKYPLPKPQKLNGTEFSAASQLFTQLTKARHLRWDDADALADDLLFTAKKANDETGSFQAVRAEDGRPITAALAAIRAVWLASGPQPAGRPRIR
jgi:hypothetical protein